VGNRDFRLVLGGGFVNNVGDWLLAVACPPSSTSRPALSSEWVLAPRGAGAHSDGGHTLGLVAWHSDLGAESAEVGHDFRREELQGFGAGVVTAPGREAGAAEIE